MKQKSKHYLKIGILLFGISFLLANCDRDLEEEVLRPTKGAKYKIEILGHEKIRFNDQIVKKLNRLGINLEEDGSNPDVFSREIHNEELGFTVVTDFVKHIEDTETGINSYNFPIVRDSSITQNVENLLLQSNGQGGYDAYILEYGFTKEQYSSLTEEFLGTTTTKYTPIDFDVSVFNDGEVAKMAAAYFCIEIWALVTVPNHQGELNPNGPLYVQEWVLTSSQCSWIYYDDGDSGGGWPGNGQSNGGGGGSGSGNNGSGQGQNPSDPGNHGNIPPLISDPTVQDLDCAKLKVLVQKPIANQPHPIQVRTLLNQLQSNTTATTKEMGYFLNPVDATQAEFVPFYFEGEEGADEVEMVLGTNAVSVFMHLHYNNEAENKKQLSVFSLQDLYEIYKFIGAGHIFSPGTFTSFLTTEHGTNYAIQINDPNAFVNSGFALKYFVGWEFDNIKKAAEEVYGEDVYEILPNKTNSQNELAFTKFLANENLGLTVFRANNDFTEFTRLEYKNGTFKETPCN